MKKQREFRLTIKRTSTSPYFSTEFNQRENEALRPYADMLATDSLEASDVLITNTHTHFDLLTDEELAKLKLIIHPNAGYDNVPVDFIKAPRPRLSLATPFAPRPSPSTF